MGVRSVAARAGVAAAGAATAAAEPAAARAAGVTADGSAEKTDGDQQKHQATHRISPSYEYATVRSLIQVSPVESHNESNS